MCNCGCTKINLCICPSVPCTPFKDFFIVSLQERTKFIAVDLIMNIEMNVKTKCFVDVDWLEAI